MMKASGLERNVATPVSKFEYEGSDAENTSDRAVIFSLSFSLYLPDVTNVRLILMLPTKITPKDCCSLFM